MKEPLKVRTRVVIEREDGMYIGVITKAVSFWIHYRDANVFLYNVLITNKGKKDLWLRYYGIERFVLIDPTNDELNEYTVLNWI